MTFVRAAGRCGAAILLVAGTVLAAAAPAAATPGLDGARRRASALRAEVERLELRVQIAVEDYNAAQDELTQVVSNHLTAQAELDDARAAVAGAGDRRDDRVRSIYMSGGSVALYLSVLDAGDIADVFSRLANVSAVVGADAASVSGAEADVHRIAAAEAALDAVTARQTSVEKRAGEAAARVREALGRQRSLLAAADAQVLRLVEEQRRAAQAAAERAFAARLAAARGLTVVPGNLLDILAGDTTRPPNAIAARAIAAARTQLGKPYQWGATGPGSFDCSGLTGWAYRQAGLQLPRTSRQQWFAGTHPDLADLAPGDLLFWGGDRSNPQSIHHVALYIGGGYMIAAARTGTPVRIQPVYHGDFFGVTRPTAARS